MNRSIYPIGLALLVGAASPCSGQVVFLDDTFHEPLWEGQRAVTFSIDRQGKPASSIRARLYYSTDPAKLNDLHTASGSSGTALLSGGDAVLVNSPGGLLATFVLPHARHKNGPTRDYYVQLKTNGVDGLIAMPSIDNTYQELPWAGQTVPPFSSSDSPIEFKPVVIARGECVFYRIAVSSGSAAAKWTPVRDFRMPDSYNIVLAGDSYGSGEGAPEDGDTDASRWDKFAGNDDCYDCHRSDNSGLVVGVRKFIEKYPEVAVDYVHVACSGAVISNLILEEQDPNGGSKFGYPVMLQIPRAKDIMLAKHDRVHALVMSIGGNDAGFGDWVMNYLVSPARLDLVTDIDERVQSQIEPLAGRYVGLEEELTEIAAETTNRFNPVVAICTYPNPTIGPKGYCGSFGANYSCCMLETDLIWNPKSDYELTSKKFVAPLNEQIRDCADTLGWKVIELGDSAGDHSYCNCDDPWFNTLGASLVAQGDTHGTAHPNERGYRKMYGPRVLQRVTEMYDKHIANRTIAAVLAAVAGGDTGLPEPCPTSVAQRLTMDRLFSDLKTMVPELVDPQASGAGLLPPSLGSIKVREELVRAIRLGKAGSLADSKDAKVLRERLKALSLAHPGGRDATGKAGAGRQHAALVPIAAEVLELRRSVVAFSKSKDYAKLLLDVNAQHKSAPRHKSSPSQDWFLMDDIERELAKRSKKK